VTPEVTTLVYTYEAFTVREHILIPRNEPGAILLLEVETTTPLAIIPGFLPVMQPMWPAGVGGQFSYWDEEVNGYVISEGQWRAEFICGSPAGRQMAAPPAHMFADNRCSSARRLPERAPGEVHPIVMPALPRYDDLKVLSTGSHLRSGRTPNATRDCPTTGPAGHDAAGNHAGPAGHLAYEWGKVALDNLMIRTPARLRDGGGFGPRRRRPPVRLFFGGDAFVLDAMNSSGMFRQSRALAFTQKWQRRENPCGRNNVRSPKDVGKMALSSPRATASATGGTTIVRI
jgi:hypothetical protein